MPARHDLGPKPRLGYTDSTLQRAAELRLKKSEVDALAADPSAFATGGRQVVVQTDAGGFARAFLWLGTEAGGHTVSASALLGPAGAQTTETETFMATAQPSARASLLVIVSGDNQTVPIDTLSPPDSPLNRGRQPNPLVVQVLDDFGNPVQGVAVQWRVSDGGGAMFSFTTFSDPLGFATNVYTGVTEGANAIIAIAAGTQPVQFDITGKVIVKRCGIDAAAACTAAT